MSLVNVPSRVHMSLDSKQWCFDLCRPEPVPKAPSVAAASASAARAAIHLRGGGGLDAGISVSAIDRINAWLFPRCQLNLVDRSLITYLDIIDWLISGPCCFRIEEEMYQILQFRLFFSV